ncbi:threonine-phosphate decarboxylase CobD [Magnetovibrio sp.]|uniref:threonine-phosphate decarboxylase CobD n=1 Tax=Magnetovibrio sp. TaxID=2024836 RepID=UPI002F95FDBF
MDTLVTDLGHTKTIQHGGDPKAVEARFPAPKDGWLDLSTGINPVPYPLPPVPGKMFARLPLQADLQALLDAARRAYGVPDRAAIVASPGTQALIQMVPTLFAPSSVSIMGPTYGEHAPAWSVAGHRVEDVRSICAQAAQPAPFGVVVHPNNPDGRTQTVEGLLAFSEELHDRGGVLVVDEAFADVTPELSVTPHAGSDGLVVLRSFGKFFGLAGVRLGFAVTTPDIAQRLSAKLGPWAVSGPALWAGTHALDDRDWTEAARVRLKSDARRLDDILQRAGFKIVGGTDLFRLGESDDAPAVFEKLGQAGILVRPFDYQPRWLRFGLPGTQADWARLEAALNA